MTSRASSTKPDTKATTSQGRPSRPTGAGVARLAAGVACAGRPFRSASRAAAPAAVRLAAPAASAVPRIPRAPISQVSAATAPATAPSVFQPYKPPNARPNCVPDAVSARVSSGSVQPMAVEGTSSSAKAMPSRHAFSSHT